MWTRHPGAHGKAFNLLQTIPEGECQDNDHKFISDRDFEKEEDKEVDDNVMPTFDFNNNEVICKECEERIASEKAEKERVTPHEAYIPLFPKGAA
jgi:hypothetical protein